MEAKDINIILDRVNQFGGSMASRFVSYITQLRRLNKLYDKAYDESADVFLDKLMDSLGVSLSIDDEDLNKIPKDGAFITVSNHPYGGLDEIILLKLLKDVRPDYKVISNHIMQNIAPLKDSFFAIDDNKRDSIKDIEGYIASGYSFGVFPAGSVSTYNTETNSVEDRAWDHSILKTLFTAKVPIVPIYISGMNSVLYHVLGVIHPILRTMRGPSEMLNKKNRVIKIRIGSPIPVHLQKTFIDVTQFGRFLRAKTNLLGSSLEVKNFFKIQAPNKGEVEEVVKQESDISVFTKELELIEDDYLLFRMKDYAVYCAPSFKIPKILNEIGRLRELTFRAVGEGTNRSIDLDEYDLYYYHLFIWDEKENKMVGAYRAGKGKEIIDRYGIKGFYIHSLFNIKNKMMPVLYESIELGRSFVAEDYQRKPLPLFMLWKGILYFLIKNPEYRYLTGPVTISGNYSSTTKDIIIKFIKKHFYNNELAKYISSRVKYKVVTKQSDIDDLVNTTIRDISVLDKIIGDFEPNAERLPVLLKKYIALNGEILGFNVDPSFNMCLDGLLILDLFKIPLDTLESLSKEINDDTMMQRFSSTNSL